MISGLEAALLVGIGGALCLDRWPVLQTMVSRPIVVGPVAGLVLGDPAGGAFWGAVFEVAYLGFLPVGAARYPNETIAALVGTVVAITGARTGTAPAGWAVVAGLGAGWLGDRADRLHRRWNGRLARRATERVEAGDPGGLGRAVAGGVASGFVIGAATTGVALALALAGLTAVEGTPWAGRLPNPTIRVAVLATVGAFGVRLFDPRSRWGSWVTGALLGAGVTWGMA